MSIEKAAPYRFTVISPYVSNSPPARGARSPPFCVRPLGPLPLLKTSIKAVMPALTGRGYDGLEIAESATACLEFMRTHFGTCQ